MLMLTSNKLRALDDVSVRVVNGDLKSCKQEKTHTKKQQQYLINTNFTKHSTLDLLYA